MYKIGLPRNWNIQNVIPVLSLQKNITRKRRVHKLSNDLPRSHNVLKTGDNNVNKFEAIIDSIVYSQRTND